MAKRVDCHSSAHSRPLTFYCCNGLPVVRLFLSIVILSFLKSSYSSFSIHVQIELSLLTRSFLFFFFSISPVPYLRFRGSLAFFFCLCINTLHVDDPDSLFVLLGSSQKGLASVVASYRIVNALCCCELTMATLIEGSP